MHQTDQSAPQRDRTRLERHFTVAGRSPYDDVEWERRDARLVDHRDGTVAFEQLGVEFPASWSVTSSNIVAQKYFRGPDGRRESSLRQVIDRVVDTIGAWGGRDGYFADEAEGDTFAQELRHLLVNQLVSFNSPVWFNIGVPGVAQQASACFILDVEDDLRSILNWYVEEGVIFKGGSGAGANLSKIRSSKERLSGGGIPSGPVSFMRGADASAGTIKSGGTTRRAAKMVILDADHPDIEDFIWCKAREERKGRVLAEAGFDMSLDGADAASMQYQNANNSVRLSDEFMRAAVADEEWALTSRTDGSTIEQVPARKILRDIAEASWECADPGVQFDTTINRWNTTPNAGRIEASNPCFTGDSLVHTDKGLVDFRSLLLRTAEGETFGIYTHDATNPDAPAERVELSTPDAVMVTGVNEIVRLRFSNGSELRCTPNHPIFTANRGFVRADELDAEDRVRTLDQEAPATRAERKLPAQALAAIDRRKWEPKSRPLHVPEKWDDELAYFLGWLTGDGCIGANSHLTTFYGTPEEQATVLPRHQAWLAEINDGFAPKAVLHPQNGELELRVSRAGLIRYFEALGVRRCKAPEKQVPATIFEAPVDAQVAFLRGLFDTDGCVVNQLVKGTRYVGLGSSSRELLVGTQRLLTAFGIGSRIYATRGPSETGFTSTTVDGEDRSYRSSAMYDLRISSANISRFAKHIGFGLESKQQKLEEVLRNHSFYETDQTVRLVERVDDGVELTYDLTEPRNHSFIVNGVLVHNCSEHLRLPNSACNLASLNLLGFLDESGTFDVDAFDHAVQVVVTAQDILVGASDYPTDKIAEMTATSRDIGIGYTNLGACLMALGFAYDSDNGRAWAATITGLLTGAAAERSTALAARLGPAPLFESNRDEWTHIYEMHLDAARQVPSVVGQPALNDRLVTSWTQALDRIRLVGARNAELSVAAPTGTISFMMGADTTGIEPDLGLVKYKKLVGGGSIEIVNQTVPRALRRLGYDDDQIAAIVEYIAEHHSVLGSPHLDPTHLPVFACAMGDNAISYGGHLRMMAAIQPFFSGAMSKTVNVPAETTVDEIEQLLIDAWETGIKCLALYRDNSKVAQPLSTGKQPVAAVSPQTAVEAVVAEVARPTRERLPRSRSSRTFEFRVADCKGFVTVGEYPDGRPGELFIRVSKQGSTLAGIMDAFAISVSHGLQYGVPLTAFVHAFVGMRFEPAGMTDDPEVRIANSLIDYLFRRLALEYLPYDERVDLGILGTSERLQPTLPGVEEHTTQTASGLDLSRPAELSSPPVVTTAARVAEPDTPLGAAADSPLCMQCGIQMTRAGSCFVCQECGTTSGCS